MNMPAEGLSYINHQGKMIMYINYSIFSGMEKNTQKEKVLQLLKSASEAYKKHPPKSLLILINVTDVFFDMEILNAFRKSRENDMYEKRLAVLGIKGLVKATYNFVVGLTQDKESIRTFDTEAEAKDWLVAD